MCEYARKFLPSYDFSPKMQTQKGLVYIIFRPFHSQYNSFFVGFSNCTRGDAIIFASFEKPDSDKNAIKKF